MSKFDVEIKFKGLSEWFGKALPEGLRKTIMSTAEKVRQDAPSKTGKLKNSITATYEGGLKGTIKIASPYASYLHEGTGIYGPHGKGFFIRPKKKKALFWKGAMHPVRAVFQRGIKPMDFLRKHISSDSLATNLFSNMSIDH